MIHGGIPWEIHGEIPAETHGVVPEGVFEILEQVLEDLKEYCRRNHYQVWEHFLVKNYIS